jgi:glycosyltransferase involved in cell wall biosynthesis
VVDGSSGCVIPPGDATALCRAVTAMYADRVRAAAMGRAARARCEQKFSLQRMCAAHADLYLSLCEPSRTGSAL